MEEKNKKVVHFDTKNLTMADKWIRLFFMVVFAIINYFVRFLVLAIALFQFLIVLFQNKPNTNLVKFGGSLSTYSYQIMLFLTYNADQKPFPFAGWPQKKAPAQLEQKPEKEQEQAKGQ